MTGFRVKHRSSQITNLMSENNIYPCSNQELHWLPIEYRVVFIKINLVTFKCLHDSAPCYLQERLETHKPPQTRTSFINNYDTSWSQVFCSARASIVEGNTIEAE